MTKKKFIALLLVLTMTFVFSSCGNKNTESEEPQQVSEYVQVGTVIDYNLDGGFILIETDHGEMMFAGDSVKTAEVVYGQDTDGIHKNDVVRVTYQGEADGVDTTNCTVTRIVVQAAKEYEMNAILKDIDMTGNNIVVENHSGKKLTFDISHATKHFTYGLKKGHKIEIIYTGEINGDDTSACDVRSIIDADGNKDEREDTITIKAVSQTVYVKGAVKVRAGCATTTKVLGHLKKGDKVKRTGITSNGWSRVEYKGKDAYINSKFLSKKEIKPEPKPTKPTKPTTKPTKPTTEPTKPTTDPTKPTQTETQTETVTPTETETETQTQTETEKPTETETETLAPTETETVAPTEEPTEPTEPEVKEITINGTVEEGSTMAGIKLKTSDGVVSVDPSNAEVHLVDEGLVVGETLYVTYDSDKYDGGTIMAKYISDKK